MLNDRKVRIGMVNFINTAPLYDTWQRTVNRPEWNVVEASPSVLNRMLFANELDMGLVSSQEYAVHPQDYLILDDISISASGPVGSVFLFSRCDPKELTDKTLLLSGQSQTSVSLVKIILEKFYHVFPKYAVGSALEAQENKNIEAVLAIGDEALVLAQNKTYPYMIDLSKIWYEKTSLPFVFAIWAIRKEFCSENPELVMEIQHELLRCRNKGKQDLKNISERVAPRVSMDSEACYEYLCGIEHDLSPDKKKGLIRFIEYLIERGEGVAEALPLNIFSSVEEKAVAGEATQSAEEKKRFVREKFASISDKYDLLNSLLSLKVDSYWRWVTTRELKEFPEGAILDLCAGTLPLSLELTRQAAVRKVVAIDFCEEMLLSGLKTLPEDERRERITAVCGDGEEIPAASEKFWGVTVAFGVRNLARTEKGLAEMWRVLKPGGKLLILEFSRPRNVFFKPVYNFYLNLVLPKIAGLVSGDKEAYEYLASSIEKFYEPEELLAMIKEAGFSRQYYRPLTMGIVTLYIGIK